MSRHDADLEHDRQMAAIHQARSQIRALTDDERRAHAELADRYERRAQRGVVRLFASERSSRFPRPPSKPEPLPNPVQR